MVASELRADASEPLDPRRWLAAAVVIVSVAIPVLDNTVLYVAIKTIQTELDADLLSIQWVVTGYSLTFATLLIIGGRLVDVYGHRRTFIIGAALFGFGSFIASISGSVPVLFVGEAVIEGVGASLMLPATLAILSSTFRGSERATAFAAWGAVAGAAVAFGPVLGGYLATYHSWRWAFRINVIVAPIFVLGAFLLMPRDPRPERRPRLDVPGACMIAAASFALIFGLSEGARYGWWHPIDDVRIGDWTLWPASRAVSVTPFAFAFAFVMGVVFVVYERARERRDRDPLFAFGQLRHRGFRYGLLTSMVLAIGQFGLLFVLPLWLQDSSDFSAYRVGLWMVPMGTCIALGAPIGGWLTKRIDTTSVVRIGLLGEMFGLAATALAISEPPSFAAILPGTLLFGLGVGFGASQLTNVVLADVDEDKMGVASGTNATVRQVGLAIGIATFASLLEINSIADGARPALLFAATVVTIGTILSLLIPRTGNVEAARVQRAPTTVPVTSPSPSDLP